VVEDSLLCGRAGSAVIEHILCKDEQKYHNLDLGLKETMMVACWYIWWLRRRRTHDEEVPPVNRCMISILSITSNAKVGRKGHSTGAVWVKPKPRYVKLNVDASFHVDSRTGAVGAILRDSHGRFLAASTKYVPYVGSVAEAEAIAMKEGLWLANRKGCNAVLAESDSLETIEALSGPGNWWTGSAGIYADCIDLAFEIGDVSYAHCPREANKTAHELARVCFIDKIPCN
jgi:ribonuclease HI